ncbi:acetyltransferase [Pricia sp.]|uniref:acetyltransferase n=1 Tax=Pricia sp. TaxID=2268138 RepID=UPI0035937C19
MKNIVIIGASGHGSMILDCVEKQGRYNVLGFVDSFKEKGTIQNGYEILGCELDLPRLTAKFDLHGIILAIGNNWTRKNMADRIGDIAPDLRFVTAIHPSALIGKDVKIGSGSVIMPGAIVNANSRIADFCILNTKSSLGHDGRMEEFSSIASGVCTGGNLTLGRFSAVSLGANIIENITVGEHSVIGAGSLVVKDVGGYSVVYGSPARFIRKRGVTDPYLSSDRKFSDLTALPMKI